MGKGGVEKMAFFCYIICGRPLRVRTPSRGTVRVKSTG